MKRCAVGSTLPLRAALITPAIASCLITLCLASGCARTAQHGVTSPRSVNASASSQETLLYREAKERFSKRDFAGALRKLDTLASSPDVTPTQQAFFERQRQICRDALSGKKPSSTNTAPRIAFAPSVDCGPRALLLVCQEKGIAAPSLARVCKVAGMGKEGTTLAGLAKAAQAVGLKASGVQMDRAALGSLDQPAIAWVDGSHYIAVLEVQTSLTGVAAATVHDPSEPNPKQMSVEELLTRSGGVLLVLTKDAVKVAARD